MKALLLDWLRDPVANAAPYDAQQLRDLAHDEIVLLRTERINLQVECEKLRDRIGVLERRLETQKLLSSSDGGAKQ